MATQRNALKVGVMTVVVAVTAFAILIWISKGIDGDLRGITIRFKSDPNMPSLGEGSAVVVGGQWVGRVLTAELKTPEEVGVKERPDRPYYVLVRAEIKEFIQLRRDCRVVAEGPPLGGDGLVKIDVGKSPDVLPDDAIIEADTPGGFGAILASIQGEFDSENPEGLLALVKTQLDPGAAESLMNKLLKSMDDINAMTAALNLQMSPDERATLMAKLHDVMNNVNFATAALRSEFDPAQRDVLLGKVHVAIDSINEGLAAVTRIMRTSEKPLEKAVGHVASSAEKLDTRIIEDIAAQTDPNNVAGLVSRINLAAEQLNRSMKDINDMTDTTREILVLNRENVNKMLLNFKETSDHLKSAVKYVLERPWRLLNEPSQTETRQHAIFDAARNFAEAANRIDDATAQLKALAELHNGNIPADSPDLERIRTDLEQSRAKFTKAEEELWKELDVK